MEDVILILARVLPLMAVTVAVMVLMHKLASARVSAVVVESRADAKAAPEPSRCPACREPTRANARHCHRCGRMTAEAHAALSVEESIKRIYAERRAREESEREERAAYEKMGFQQSHPRRAYLDDCTFTSSGTNPARIIISA